MNLHLYPLTNGLWIYFSSEFPTQGFLYAQIRGIWRAILEDLYGLFKLFNFGMYVAKTEFILFF